MRLAGQRDPTNRVAVNSPVPIPEIAVVVMVAAIADATVVVKALAATAAEMVETVATQTAMAVRAAQAHAVVQVRVMAAVVVTTPEAVMAVHVATPDAIQVATAHVAATAVMAHAGNPAIPGGAMVLALPVVAVSRAGNQPVAPAANQAPRAVSPQAIDHAARRTNQQCGL